jgi:hypothetical protein
VHAAWLRGLSLAAVGGLGAWSYWRYRASRVMDIAVREFSSYPEDPAHRSVRYGQYSGRRLTLVQKDDSHFDFIFAPVHEHVAVIAFRSVDVSLMTPSLPEWTRHDAGLRRIALTDRQWNRQQVRFDRDSPQLDVSCGDGFEQANVFTAELAKNCLNAGLWELLLFMHEAGRKALYYHGWFTFPLGHYKRIFQRSTDLSYWRHFYYLEHWVDPEGVRIPLDRLRRVTREREVPARFEGDEPVIAAGEQVLKKRTVLADVMSWKDFYDGRPIRFATFARPRRYDRRRPWHNELWRMERFDRCILRDVLTPATSRPLQEFELVFTGRDGGTCRFIVSGFDVEALPQIPIADYRDGLSMPMGIGSRPCSRRTRTSSGSPRRTVPSSV